MARSASDTPTVAARAARRALASLSRPSSDFDASRYFRGADDLQFFNVGATAVRGLARRIVAEHPTWSVDDALAFAETLMPDHVLEVKGVAVEVVARYRKALKPTHLPALKRWLADGHSANWATTDAICGNLIGPLVLSSPQLAGQMRRWSTSANLWVRRASIVALIPSVRKGAQLDLAYALAHSVHADTRDLIHKAAGWMLREAGRTDEVRLERYLLEHGPQIPRTTLRYAIERFDPARRRSLLARTRPARSSRSARLR